MINQNKVWIILGLCLWAFALFFSDPTLSHGASQPPQINAGDTGWILTSSALVLLMTIPGLFLFYGGLVRGKNVLGTIMHSFIIVALISILWVLWG